MTDKLSPRLLVVMLKDCSNCILKGVNVKEKYKEVLIPGAVTKFNRKSAYNNSDMFMGYIRVESHYLN